MPCPAITSGWSKGGTNSAPDAAASATACALASSKLSPWRTAAAPRARTASTLIVGVTTGMTIVAGTPSVWAASATPCAWFPADAATTPAARRAAGARAIMLYAPRSLNEKTGCVSSRLSSTVAPRRADRRGAASRGVSFATSYTRAETMRSR